VRSGRPGPGAQPAVRSLSPRTDRGRFRRGHCRPGRPGDGAGGLGGPRHVARRRRCRLV